jgi:hypothetical protein
MPLLPGDPQPQKLALFADREHLSARPTLDLSYELQIRRLHDISILLRNFPSTERAKNLHKIPMKLWI